MMGVWVSPGWPPCPLGVLHGGPLGGPCIPVPGPGPGCFSLIEESCPSKIGGISVILCQRLLQSHRRENPICLCRFAHISGFICFLQDTSRASLDDSLSK